MDRKGDAAVNYEPKLRESLNLLSRRIQEAREGLVLDLHEGGDEIDKRLAAQRRQQAGEELARLIKERSSIEEALGRVDSGSYGICEACDSPISSRRLEVLPAAHLCIKCQEKSEKLERNKE